MRAESLDDIPEGELIAMMLSDSGWGTGRILNIHGFPDRPRWRTEVSLATLDGGRGDVDVLLSNPCHPESAVAIQAKRVKVGADALRTGMPNGLRNLRKLRQQANHVARLGFEQVYAYVMVVVDSRSLNAMDSPSYVGMQTSLRDLVHSEARRLDGLDDCVGLIVVYVTQSMDYPPLSSGFGGVRLIRKARSTEQPALLTVWVDQQFGAAQAALAPEGKQIAPQAVCASPRFGAWNK